MKILRLGLVRYGHLLGEALELELSYGLHVVVGANEAGKSTALEALSDALFGFSNRDSRAYAHPSDPSVAFTLVTADGQEASFVRRKRTKDSLLDGAGTVLSEVSLARFLGGTSRQRFRRVFGLNGEQLRAGGRTILSEHGDAGAAVLQAQTGLHRTREVIDQLDKAANGLFGTRHGQKRFWTAAKQADDNAGLVAERSLSPSGYAEAQAHQVRLAERLAAIAAETAEKGRVQSRLQRTRRVAPVRAALAASREEKARLGLPPDLPTDAAARREAALREADLAAHDLGRDQVEAELVDLALAGLSRDLAVLAEAAAIDALDRSRTHIASMRHDLSMQQAEAASRRRALDAAAAELRLLDRGEALRACIPDAALRRQVERLRRQHDKRVGARTTAEAALAKVQTEHGRADHSLAALAAPAPTEALRVALDLASQDGPIDTELAAARADRDARQAEAVRLLSRLPLWTGTLDALEASPAPLPSDITQAAEALGGTGVAATEAARKLDELDRKLEACAARLAAAERAGPVPTAEAIATLRERRDRAWRLIRRHFVEAGPAPSATEWLGDQFDAPAALPALLDTLLREADALSDRRTTEAVRVQEWESAAADQVLLTAMRTGLAAQSQAAADVLIRAEDRWRRLWQPAGIVPLDPAAMRDWSRARDAILAAAQAARDAARRHDGIAARHAAALARLRPHVADGQDDVAALRQTASLRLRALDAAAKAHADGTDASRRAHQAVRDAQADLAALDDGLDTWRAQWFAIAARLGLDDDADPAEASQALDRWERVKTCDRDLSNTAGRVDDMTAALQRDEADIAALAARLGLPVTERLVGDLAARLETAQAAEREAALLGSRAAALADGIAAAERRAAAADATLLTLRRRAEAADDAALLAAIGRGAQHALLDAELARRLAELHAQSDGRSEEELAAEARSIETDDIPATLATLAQRLEDLGEERQRVAVEAAEAGRVLRMMEAGQDVAGPALAVEDAHSVMEDSARRYMVLRLAHTMLKGGIDGFRRQQQGPLLAAASRLFAELTTGRYVQLEQDEDKSGAFIVAIRPDHTTCRADMLSEGTSDQLFLALRLASIRLEAAHAEPLPFIADDLLVNFDDARAAAALHLLAEFGATTQVLMFTHHDHLAELARAAGAMLHRLPRELAA